mmetsp:Transcript_107399/g.256608  ORF Transcript_107399/g.256608 Transcript_107399/m.256608 type:complete len:423 (-) Transcript_107399:503-1771(-)
MAFGQRPLHRSLQFSVKGLGEPPAKIHHVLYRGRVAPTKLENMLQEFVEGDFRRVRSLCISVRRITRLLKDEIRKVDEADQVYADALHGIGCSFVSQNLKELLLIDALVRASGNSLEDLPKPLNLDRLLLGAGHGTDHFAHHTNQHVHDGNCRHDDEGVHQRQGNVEILRKQVVHQRANLIEKSTGDEEGLHRCGNTGKVLSGTLCPSRQLGEGDGKDVEDHEQQSQSEHHRAQSSSDCFHQNQDLRKEVQELGHAKQPREPQQPRDTYDAGVCEDGPYMVTLQQQVEERQKPNLNGHGHDQEKVEKKPEVASPLPHAAESQKSNGDLQHEEAAEELLNPKEHGACVRVHNMRVVVNIHRKPHGIDDDHAGGQVLKKIRPRDALTHACVLVPVLVRLLDSLSILKLFANDAFHIRYSWQPQR